MGGEGKKRVGRGGKGGVGRGGWGWEAVMGGKRGGSVRSAMASTTQRTMNDE